MTNVNDSLPEGWVIVYDQEYKTNFYVNENTRESQWERPTGPAPLVRNDDPPKYELYESKPAPAPKKKTQSRISPYEQQITTDTNASHRQTQQRYSSLISGSDRSSYSSGTNAIGGLLLASALANAATPRYHSHVYDGYGSGFGGCPGYQGFGGHHYHSHHHHHHHHHNGGRR